MMEEQNSGRLRLGIAAPVFAAAGVPDLRTPGMESVDPARVMDAVRLADELGYDSAWFSDHLFHGVDGAFLECWTTTCFAAASTTQLRIVTNHLGLGFRSAPLVGKMAATLDRLSNGRFELFVSHGLRSREHSSYGFGWEPDVGRRLARLAEGVDVIRALWRGEPVDFRGEFFTLEGALSLPTPAHDIPIWLGGPLDPRSASVIAAKADGWNSLPASLDEYAERAEIVDAACRAEGRPPGSLRRSLETQVLILDDADDWRGWLERWSDMRRRRPHGFATADMFPDGSSNAEVDGSMAATFVIGDRDEVAARLAAYGELGVEEIALWFMDQPSEATMRTLAAARVPAETTERTDRVGSH
jgi:alkanesulfonate monooxygenase SsuD/methylene tetrahydromethanopterin reductase-like flavin-dependent oxidoreductase (luciferase family)